MPRRRQTTLNQDEMNPNFICEGKLFLLQESRIRRSKNYTKVFILCTLPDIESLELTRLYNTKFTSLHMIQSNPS